MSYILIPMGEKRGVTTLKKTNTRKSSDFFNVVKVGKSLCGLLALSFNSKILRGISSEMHILRRIRLDNKPSFLPNHI